MNSQQLAPRCSALSLGQQWGAQHSLQCQGNSQNQIAQFDSLEIRSSSRHRLRIGIPTRLQKLFDARPKVEDEATTTSANLPNKESTNISSTDLFVESPHVGKSSICSSSQVCWGTPSPHPVRPDLESTPSTCGNLTRDESLDNSSVAAASNKNSSRVNS